jgi:hypothetical protein
MTAFRKGHPEIIVSSIVDADAQSRPFIINAAAVARPQELPDKFKLLHAVIGLKKYFCLHL